MKFTNLKQIQEYFDIHATDLDVVKEALNQLRMEIHPDRNNGEFKNENEKERYYLINDALDYVVNLKNNSQLLVVEKMNELVKAVVDLIPINQENSKQQRLENKINNAITNYRSRLFIPKVSITAVTGVITFLFAIPSTIKDNPTLAQYINPQSPTFVIIWLCLLCYTGFFWIITLMNEERVKRRLSLLNVDSTQNEIFEGFIQHPDREFFTKDELTDHIFRRFSPVSSSILLFGGTSITMEIAQNVAEIIIGRAQSKGIIKISNSNSLSDRYTIIRELL